MYNEALCLGYTTVRQMRMTIGIKRTLFVVAFLTVGIGFVLPAVHESRYLKAENISLDGVVTHIEWKTKNHAQPLIELKATDGSLHSLDDGELNFKEGQLNVGDAIIKKSGSRYCYINKMEFECINEFVGFHKAVLRAINGGEPNAHVFQVLYPMG